MNLYIYTDGKKVVGKGFNISSCYESHEVSAVDFNCIDSELIESGLFLYKNGVLTEDSDVRQIMNAAEIRAKRDNLLCRCDWTQLDDSPLDESSKALWAEYRQALRDIPQQSDFPLSVVFPDEP